VFDVTTIAQAAFFVEGHGGIHHAYWLEYEIGGRRRTQVVVFKPQRLLLPPTGIALGYAASAYDITRPAVAAWLEAEGYRIVDEMDVAPKTSS